MTSNPRPPAWGRDARERLPDAKAKSRKIPVGLSVHSCQPSSATSQSSPYRSQWPEAGFASQAHIHKPYSLSTALKFGLMWEKYFYVLVRHAFMQADISNPDVAAYVAGVLAQGIGLHADDPLQDIARGYTHASDFLAIISSATDHGFFQTTLS